jgi:AraC-like DNA-binding protein
MQRAYGVVVAGASRYYELHVKPAAGIDDFLADPIGRYVAGASWLYFYADEGLCGFTLWARPGEDDLKRLVRVLAVELGAKPHASLVDTRRVEAIDAGAYAVLGDYVARNWDALGAAVTSLAIVRLAGYVGALAEGFYRVATPPYPVQLFAELGEALAWLGRADDALERELDALHAVATGASPFVRDLRALLDARPGQIELSEAARVLGTSERVLQRRLREDATSFRAEVGLSQVRVAKVLLVTRDAKLSEIAQHVGCASLQHFSTLFRRLTGETPSDFRARHR